MQGNAPISFATIAVESPAAAAGSPPPIGGALTGENGRFVVQGLAPGTYRVRISFPGFLEADADVLVSPLNQRTTLATSVFPESRASRRRVTVTAERMRLAGRRHAGIPAG